VAVQPAQTQELRAALGDYRWVVAEVGLGLQAVRGVLVAREEEALAVAVAAPHWTVIIPAQAAQAVAALYVYFLGKGCHHAKSLCNY